MAQASAPSELAMTATAIVPESQQDASAQPTVVRRGAGRI